MIGLIENIRNVIDDFERFHGSGSFYREAVGFVMVMVHFGLFCALLAIIGESV